MTQAKRDQNRVPTLLGVSSVDLTTPTLVAVNPETGAMLAEGTVTATVAWGDITGTLSNQTDLQTALNAKADAATTITISGTANEISSSAGAQSLAANRTWTLSLPSEIDLGGKTSLEIPNSDAPTVNANGEIAIDNLVADFDEGIIKYYSTAEMGVVAMPIAQFTSPTDGYVVAYNATDNNFELVEQSGGGVPGGSNTQIQYNNAGAFGGSLIEYVVDVATPILQTPSASAENLTTSMDLVGTGLGLLSGSSEITSSGDISTGSSIYMPASSIYDNGTDEFYAEGSALEISSGGVSVTDESEYQFLSGGDIEIGAGGVEGSQSSGGSGIALGGGEWDGNWNGGSMEIYAGDSGGGDGDGGSITLSAGTNSGTGTAGTIRLQSRVDGGVSIENSNVGHRAIFSVANLDSNNRTFTFPDTDGTFVVSTPNATQANNVDISAGNSTGSGNDGGDITITAGNAGAGNANGGNVSIFAGEGTGTGVNGNLTMWVNGDAVFSVDADASFMSMSMDEIELSAATRVLINSGGGSSAAFDTNSLSTGRTFTFPNATGTFVLADNTATLTNKRVTPRTGTTASSATPTINTDTVDFYSITALSTAITSMTTNLSGTPTDGQLLRIAITDNGTSRAITWGSSFESSGTVSLPTATVISTRLDVILVWNTATSKWRCIGTA